MEAEHTNGPWGIFTTSPHLIRAADGLIIGQAIHSMRPQPIPGESEANARMFAASSCLLEAAQAAFHRLAFLAENGTESCQEMNAVIARNVQCAIIKATGQ